MRPGAETDKVFAGSIPKMYETLMVPLIFAPYAADLAARLAPLAPRRVLEIAAGTGVVTRAMSAALGPGAAIVATDLNQPMLDMAAAVGTRHPVTWRQADAMQLPFDDGAFDAVVCQFGVMFFPDRAKAYAEARRVLRPGGTFLFNAWDRIEENEFADSPRVPAIAYCQGTPLRNEIEARDGSLEEATDRAAAAIAHAFGAGAVDGKIQAHVISATR